MIPPNVTPLVLTINEPPTLVRPTINFEDYILLDEDEPSSSDNTLVEQHVDWSLLLYDSNDKVEYTSIPIIYGLYGDEIDYDDSNNEKISFKESSGNS